MVYHKQQLKEERDQPRPFGKHPGFIVRRHEPFNGGPQPALLHRSFITPTELFYVRNHGAVPQVDPARYRLTIGGMVQRKLELTLEDLQANFARHTLVAALQCAGNRREELMRVEPIPGEVPWGSEAVGNAAWGGVRLRDVLQAAGVAEHALHVAFTGLDEVERHGRSFGFGGSIPLEKALSEEVLLAYEMNGAPLEPVHGYPLRVVAPGYIGARSVKWLASMMVQETPSDNYFQAHAYKLFPPSARADNADWSSGMMLGDFPVSAVICSPDQGASVPAGIVTVEGYAIAGGGRTVERVDLSADGGTSWISATLQHKKQRWAWTLWTAHVELAPGQHQLIARAWDSAANTQPEDPRHIWNFKGYINNAWHRVDLLVR